jgi:hypothetical protein
MRMECPVCKLAAMVDYVEERDDGLYAIYICRDKRCPNYMKKIGEVRISDVA